MIVQNVGHGGATDLSFTVPRVELAGRQEDARADRARAGRPRADDRRLGRQGVDRRRRPAQRAGLRGADVRDARRRRRQHRDDLDLRGPDHLHDRRGRARDRPARAPRRLRARATRRRSTRRRTGSRRPDRTGDSSRAASGSPASARPTTSSAAGWPTGTPEVCLAVADEQTAGRGRDGRTLGRAARRRAPAVARVPPDLAGARTRPGGSPPSSRWRWPTPPRRSAGLRRRHDPAQVAERPRRRGAATAASASWPASSARPTASGRPIRASSSASASTRTGPPADFPPELAGSMTSLREAAGRPADRRRRAARRVPRPPRGPRRGAARRGRFDAAGLGRPPARRPAATVRLERPGRRRDGPRRSASTRRPGRCSSPTRRAGRRAPGPRRRDRPRPPRRRLDRGGGVTPWPDRHSGRWTVRRRPARASPISTAIARSSRRPRRTRPGSRPCIGSTSPRCTATRSTSSATTTRRRTPPSGRSWPPWPNLGRFEERARPADGEGASTFRVWLFQIARNAVAERRRRARRRPEAPLEAAATVAAPIDLEADVGRATTTAAAAWRAVARLPGDRRRAVVLRFVDEMTTAEIAGVLGRSEGAVRVLIHRALRSVARDLDDPAPVTGAFAGRDGDEVDALVTDRYLEALLAAHARGADRAPAADGPARRHPLAPPTGSRRDLPRLHPSFRFEEALAARLAEVACADARSRPRPAADGLVVPLRGADPVSTTSPRRRRRRPARRLRPAAAHRRRPDLGGPVARRRRLRRLAAQPAGGQPDGPGRPRRRPGRGSSDADQAAVVPRPARRLPARPVDQVPVVRDDAVQQAARQGAPRLPDLRPPLPAVRRGPARAAPRPRHVRGARRRPPVGRSRSGSSTRSPTRTGSPPPRPRPACATRRSGARRRSGGIAASRCASWTSGSWAARWARSSARRSPAPPSTRSPPASRSSSSAPPAAPGCRRARSR